MHVMTQLPSVRHFWVNCRRINFKVGRHVVVRTLKRRSKHRRYLPVIWL